MLGNAISTELQLLAARDRVTDLAATFRPSRVPDSAREQERHVDLGTATRPLPDATPLGHSAAAA
jgi:hypothetical protein